MESLLNVTIKDNKRNLTITEELYILKGEKQPNGTIATRPNMWYKYTCNICGWTEGYIRRGGLLTDKKGCVCCSCQKLVIGINDFNTLYPNLSELLLNKEDGESFVSSNKKVNIKCKDCGYIKQITLKHLSKYGFKCDRCEGGDSYPNKFMKAVLEEIKIDYIKEYSPKWISPKRFDFYIPNKNIIIEMNGLQHIKNTSFNGTRTFSDEIKKNDLFKKEKALENNIKVIEIESYFSEFNYIKENIILSLSKYFNLSNINWELCELKARNNIVKEICEHKNNNPNLFTSDIAKEYNISQATCARYLKIGTEIGWCNYNPKEESDRNIKQSIERSKSKAEKIVVMNKDNDEILGIFNSALELEEKSLGLFGVLFKQGNTRYCCKTKADRCMGYKVRYYKDVFDTVATTE